MEMRPLRLGSHAANIDRFPDGSMILSPTEPLARYARRYTERLEYWARAEGDRIFLAQRTTDGTGWRTITYRDAFAKVRHIAQALLDRGLSVERPLMILSGNEIEHALIGLAALHVGIPYSPISVSYSLISKDHAKLRHCFKLLTPGLVYVSDASAFKGAIDAVIPVNVEIVCRENPLDGRRMTSFDTLLDTAPTSAVDAAAAEVCGETPARILFTSGSTAMPKGAINTHQTACANMQMVAQVWPFTIDEPPVVCDWMPWNHTFGGGMMIGLIMHAGGSMYIDDGRPMSGQIEKTVRNLNEVRPTIFISVPASFELLLPYLESDDIFRVNFFSRLKMLYYSAASLPDETSDRYRSLAAAVTGHRIFTASGYGATEVGPLAIVCNWDTPRKGIIGLPVPGFQLRLIPNGQKLEVRIKGPAVVPGYFRQPELTAKAFDAEGWYCLGDAVRFADPNDILEGLIFDGRVVEDFKLRTGTWVSVGPLRILATNHLSPLAVNILVCGIDRAEIGLLVFPELEACRRVARMPKEATLAEILQSEILRNDFQNRLNALRARGTTTSNRIVRMRVSSVPLSDVEVTDKNTISTNVVNDRRREEIEDLYSGRPSCIVFVAEKDAQT